MIIIVIKVKMYTCHSDYTATSFKVKVYLGCVSQSYNSKAILITTDRNTNINCSK